MNVITPAGVEQAEGRSMKRWASVLLLAVTLLLIGAAPGDARHRGHHGGGARVFIGLGAPFWFASPFWWHYPPPYYAYPPPIVVQQPPVYIEQPAPPPPPPPPQSYWHYCPSAKAYYPSVATCPEPWVKVPPRPE